MFKLQDEQQYATACRHNNANYRPKAPLVFIQTRVHIRLKENKPSQYGLGYLFHTLDELVICCLNVNLRIIFTIKKSQRKAFAAFKPERLLHSFALQ